MFFSLQSHRNIFFNSSIMLNISQFVLIKQIPTLKFQLNEYNYMNTCQCFIESIILEMISITSENNFEI